MNTQDRILGSSYEVDDSQSIFLRSVYSWMTAGLATTGLISWLLISQNLIGRVITPGTIILLSFVEFGLVVWLSGWVNKMSEQTATAVFLSYSALNGITLAPLLYLYTGAAVSSTFMISGACFASMALIGTTTKRDLTSLGSFLMMGLIGLLLAGIVNIFMQSGAVSFITSVIAVIVFAGLTAWDVQNIKKLSYSVNPGTAEYRRASIIGALRLYLDFINIFINLLRILNDRR